MKHWPGVLVFVYAAAFICLIVPGVLLASAGVQARAIPGLIALVPYWLWVAAMVVCQTVLLAVPVVPLADWPLRRRSVLLPVLLTGLMVAGLACGAFYSFLEFHLQEDAYLTENYPLIWHYPLACGAALWAGWTVVFYLLSRRRHPADVVASQRRIACAGSLLGVLLTVTLHIVARKRSYCYAGVLTSFGIGFGMAVALFAFGPALLFLYSTRWQDWHMRRALTSEELLPHGNYPVAAPRIRGSHLLLGLTLLLTVLVCIVPGWRSGSGPAGQQPLAQGERAVIPQAAQQPVVPEGQARRQQPLERPQAPKPPEVARRRRPPAGALTPRLLRMPTWRERHRVQGGPEAIRYLTYSRDGTALIWASGKAVKLLDVGTGKERPSVHHAHEVRALALSPDGKALATVSVSSEGARAPELKLWDTATGKLLYPLKGHGGRAIRAVAFSPDGRLLASGGDDGYIRLWDPRTGRKRAAWWAHLRAVHALRFNPDGKVLTSLGQERYQERPISKAWDVPTGKETVWRPEPQPVSRFRERVYLADGRTGIAWQYNGTALFWDTTTGELLDEHAWGLPQGYTLVVRPDRKQFAAVDADGVVRLWEPGPPGAQLWFADATKVKAAAKARRGWAVTPLTPQGIRLAFTPDGQILITTSGAEAHLYDLDADRLLAALKGHSQPILALAVSPDSKTLATGSADGALRLWELPSGRPLGTLGQPQGEVQGLAFSRDGKTLAAGYVRRPKLKPEDEDKRPHPTSGIEHLAHAMGTMSRLPLYRSLPGEIKLWDLAAKHPRATFTGHERGVSFVAFLGERDDLLSFSGEDMSVRRWGPDRRDVVLWKGPWDHGPLAVSADGRTVALGAGVFDLAAGPLRAPRARVSFGKPVGGRVPTATVSALTPDGKTLAAMVGHLVKLCDTTSGATLAVFRGHREQTNILGPSAGQAVTFSADGRLLASADAQGVVHLWDVANITERQK